MYTRDVKLSFRSNNINKFTLWIFYTLCHSFDHFQENDPYINYRLLLLLFLFFLAWNITLKDQYVSYLCFWCQQSTTGWTCLTIFAWRHKKDLTSPTAYCNHTKSKPILHRRTRCPTLFPVFIKINKHPVGLIR